MRQELEQLFRRFRRDFGLPRSLVGTAEFFEKQNGHDILAVQTLRLQVMAATFLACTAILISLGLLGVAFRLHYVNSGSLRVGQGGMKLVSKIPYGCFLWIYLFHFSRRISKTSWRINKRNTKRF
jgi:hypothetical protein